MEILLFRYHFFNLSRENSFKKSDLAVQSGHINSLIENIARHQHNSINNKVLRIYTYTLVLQFQVLNANITTTIAVKDLARWYEEMQQLSGRTY